MLSKATDSMVNHTYSMYYKGKKQHSHFAYRAGYAVVCTDIQREAAKIAVSFYTNGNETGKHMENEYWKNYTGV